MYQWSRCPYGPDALPQRKGCLFYRTGISEGGGGEGVFKVLEPSMQELQELKLVSDEEQFLHYGF